MSKKLIISKEHWAKLDKIGIRRTLVEETACGIWFINIGAQWCHNDEQTKKLIELNTEIQAYQPN